MNPHERTLRFPFFENLALRKPCGRVAMMCFASNILNYPGIWGRQPTAKLLLQLIIYKKFQSLYHESNIAGLLVRTFDLVHFNCQFLHKD
jgi:hypothetical protein